MILFNGWVIFHCVYVPQLSYPFVYQWTSRLLPCPAATAAAKSLQSCPTLCDPIDGSPPGSAVPGILQARTLGWVAISFSNAWKWKVKVKLLSRVRLSATPWTAAYQTPPPMGFSRQEYWSGVPFIAFSEPTQDNYYKPWTSTRNNLQSLRSDQNRQTNRGVIISKGNKENKVKSYA